MPETMAGTEIVQELEKGKQDIIAKVNSAVIETQEDFTNYSSMKKVIIAMQKKVDDYWKPMIEKAFNVHKDLCNKRNELYDPLKIARATLDKKLGTWEDNQARIRAEAQRKIDEAARREREKKEAEARAQREREEAARRAQEEAERKAAAAKNEAARKKAIEEAELNRKIAEAAAAKAEAKEQAATTVVAPVLPDAVKVEGQSRRDNWKFVCTDPIAFVKWAVANNELSLLTFDQSSCNAHSKKMKKELTVPGGKFFNDKGYMNRG